TRESHRELQLLTRQGLHVDGFEPVGISGVGAMARKRRDDVREREPGSRTQNSIHRAMAFHCSLNSLEARDYSLRASAAARSMYPPRPSGTISINWILEDEISMILPSLVPR